MSDKQSETPLTDAQRILNGARGIRSDGRRYTLSEAVDADFARDHLATDDERQLIGTVLYYRVRSLDKRIARGDDFAGDAWVRYTSVGHQPEPDPRTYFDGIEDAVSWVREQQGKPFDADMMLQQLYDNTVRGGKDLV